MATDEKNLRCRALLVIFKYSKCENFDPIIPYLAMTYFDRVISARNEIFIPFVMQTVVEHDLELLAICCLTLAWKIRDKRFKIHKFKKNQPDLKNVKNEQFFNMELHILKELDWNMLAETALSLVPHFASTFCLTYRFNCRTINEIIIQSQDSTLVRKMEPRVIAASAVLAAFSYLYPEKYQIFYNGMLLEGIYKEGHLMRCTDYMIKLCSDLRLTIESDSVPKRRVRAGEKPEQDAAKTVSEQSTSEESNPDQSSTEFDFPLRWRICDAYGERFVVFLPQSESAELVQLALAASDQQRLKTQPQVARVAADPGPEARDHSLVAHVRGTLNGLLNNCCKPL